MEQFTTHYGTIERTFKNCYVKAKGNSILDSRIRRNKTYKVTEEFMGVPLFWRIVVEQINEGKLNRSFLHYITLEGVDGYFEAECFEVVEVRKSILKKIIKLWKQ